MYQLFNTYTHGFSTNPWDNLSNGISPDSQIYALGGGLYAVLFTVAIIGVVVGLITTIIMIWISGKKRGEAKERFIFYCLIVIIASAVSALLTACVVFVTAL